MLHQYERVPCNYIIAEDVQSSDTPAPSLKLRSIDEALPTSFDFTFEAIRHGVFRTTFASTNHPVPPFPSATRPKYNLEPEASRVTTDLTIRQRTISVGATKAVVEWSRSPVVTLFLEGARKPIHQDLPFRSYAVDGTGVTHYLTYNKKTLHVGLGEKAAPMNLSGRGFVISASDTFGYDAYLTDPLYKHIPLLINVTPQGCAAIFSTTHSRGTWAVGSEIDGLWGPFKVYRQAHGGLEEYLLVGKTADEVVRLYAELVGYPLLVPRYMMGYISGGMKYSMEDDPPAATVIVDFLDNCKRHDIPVSVFQMSSGYTVAETEPKTRNVFTWNRCRFPDPREFTKQCHYRGVRLLANIKPYVLASHPEYSRLAAAGAFFKDPVTKKTALCRLWSAGGGESSEGSHIDFTSKAGSDWWYQGCISLREVGIDAMWNDNNEYTLPSDDWQCALETVAVPRGDPGNLVGLWGRAMHTELMGKRSYDACVAVMPDERPLVLTRSATAGTMRYASCSWSGDNVTSWDCMKGNNSMALNAGFSLLQSYGHDIGGFEGPQPTPELLVRWVQLGIHSPRFTINCYKTSPRDNLIGEVIEPWMHPSATPFVRSAIKRRYELIPYTYSQAIKSHMKAVPPQRWTGWGYESDPEVWTKEVMAGDTQYWFGDALLVAGVYEPGATSARVYLPKRMTEDGQDATSSGFLNTNAPFQHLEAGKWHNISSVWHSSIPVLARCGSAVPVGKSMHTTARENHAAEIEFPGIAKDDWRGIEIFPPPVLDLPGCGNAEGDQESTYENAWYEDDGISSQAKLDVCMITIVYTAEPCRITVQLNACRHGSWKPLWLGSDVAIILPVGEERMVTSADGATVVDRGLDSQGRRIWGVRVKVG